jgi:ligand-binding SRPBCC domain-containing protein
MRDDYTFITEQWIPAELDDVFAFFSDAENLLRIEPQTMRLRIDEKDLVAPADVPARFRRRAASFLGAGSQVVLSYAPFARFPLWRRSHRAYITQYRWGHHFADEHNSWLMSWRHRHEFLALTREGRAGTLARDVVRYRLRPGLLGRMAHALFARRLVREAFSYRHRAMTQIVSAGALLGQGLMPRVHTA